MPPRTLFSHEYLSRSFVELTTHKAEIMRRINVFKLSALVMGIDVAKDEPIPPLLPSGIRCLSLMTRA